MAKGKTAQAEKTSAKTPKEKKVAKGPTWSIGIFRNARGKLATVYVNSAGKPMPYEAPRVGNAKILLTGKYSGVTYAEARQLLLKDAKKAGLKDEPVEKPKTEKKAAAKPNGKATSGTKAGKAGKVPAKKGSKAAAKAQAEVQEQTVASAAPPAEGSEPAEATA